MNELCVLRYVFSPSTTVVPERIQHQNIMPLRNVCIGNVGSDESGSAGDEYPHFFSSRDLAGTQASRERLMMERRPLLALGAAAAAGAAFGIAAAAIFVAACAVARGEEQRFRVFIAAALVAGALSAALHGARGPGVASAHTTRIACTVLDSGPSASGGAAFTCLDDAGGTLTVNASGLPPPIAAHLLLRGRIEPFDGPRNPGEPDEAAIQRERGIDAHAVSAQILARLPSAPLSPEIALARAHAWALSQLRSRLQEPYASIVAGELWGERGGLPPELRAQFQETGTVHVLVTAGLHLGVVALVTLAFLRVVTVPRIAACAVTIGVLWIYAAFSGFHVPALRAAAMITCGLCAHAAGAASRSWNAYGAALAAFALAWPEDLWSASFALSFSCVGAILLLGDHLDATLEHAALPERVREALVLTIATQAGTWPLTASIFLIFSPYAILANLLVVPLVGITMIVAGAELACAPVAQLAQLFANVNSWLLAWIVAAVHTIATLPHASIPMTPPKAWAIAAYDAALVSAVWLWRRDGRTLAIALIFLAVTFVLAPPVRGDTRLRITVLDVGQADGIVIQTPAGHTLLVDAGGRLERGGNGSNAEQIGERIVVPFLRRAGIRRIDALILSHPHGDHAGGMAPVLRAFPVAEFADSGQRYGGYAYNDAMQTARADSVPFVYPRAGMVWKTDDGVTLRFIGPSLPFIESNNTINDNSVAFILQYKQFRMLFTGDAGVAAEQRFLNEGIDLHADVLKVGHHGSAYSSSPAFITTVRPKYAIISVGRHNMFGHPAPSTIDTLRRTGAAVYRTDDDGALTITTDGRVTAISKML
jgi:competence protein ComEC